MGIQGLLPLLSSIHTPIHIKEFEGHAIAVDSYVWLHRGAFGCAFELAQGINTRKYINYCLKRVKLLKSFGIWPIMVFDGGHLPMKRETEEARRKRREENLAKGMEYLEAGNKSKAMEFFQTSVDVTPQMAHELIKELRKEGIEFIVAPYEADSQLAFLDQQGIVSAIITEDSDLLAFGCRNVIFKMEADGKGILIRRKDFPKIKEFKNWTDKKFRQMCILSGCDYLDSPPGVGLKRAQQYLLHTDAHRLIASWQSWGKSVKAPKLPIGYLESFIKAELTFCHQRVYDPNQCCLVPLTPFPDDFDQAQSDFVGEDLSPEIAKGIATGVIDPITKEPFSDCLKENSKNQANIKIPVPQGPRKPLSSHLANSQQIDNSSSTTNPFKQTSKAKSSPLRKVSPKKKTHTLLQSLFKDSLSAKAQVPKPSRSTPLISQYFESNPSEKHKSKDNEAVILVKTSISKDEHIFLSSTDVLSDPVEEDGQKDKENVIFVKRKFEASTDDSVRPRKLGWLNWKPSRK